ncbi:hypothetical protein [Streptomyces sp. BH105]|uniref:hypothetical protein n=1 Tax=Streptomyces sp. BH105 TaxID=3410408 RepID=UPI003CF62971
MSDIQIGHPYVLVAEDGYGSGVGAIPAGAVVTPVEVVPPGTAGVGFSVEEVVVSSYEDTVTFPGTPVARTLAIGVSNFEEAFTVQPETPQPDPDPAPEQSGPGAVTTDEA